MVCIFKKIMSVRFWCWGGGLLDDGSVILLWGEKKGCCSVFWGLGWKLG